MADTATRLPLAVIPSGLPLSLVAPLGDLIDAALTGAMLAPGRGYDEAARILPPDDQTWQDTAAALARAAAILRGDTSPPAPPAEADGDAQDEPTLAAIRETEDGVAVSVGQPIERAEEMAKNLIDAFLPALDASGAANYLEYDARSRATGQRIALIIQRHDGKSPHTLRQEAEARVAELERALEEARRG